MEELVPFFKMIFDAVTEGNWWLAVAGIFMGLVAAMRIYKDKLPAKLRPLPVHAGLTFAFAFVGGLGNALAAGEAFSFLVLQTAFSIALVAVGGWAAIEAAIKALFSKRP